MHLLKIGSIPWDEVVNLSVDLASANQNIALLEIEKSDLEAQLASADQDNENGTNEIAQLESLIDALNASLNENISMAASLQAQLDDAFADLSEANTQISLLESQWSNANQTIALLAAGWNGANSTITSLISTYSSVNLVETLTLDYSEYCLGPATQMNSGLDNGDGGGTAADGQLHDGEIDESKLSCQTTMMVKDVNDGDGDSFHCNSRPLATPCFL